MKGTGPRALTLGIALSLGLGCISENRRGVDDTGTPDILPETTGDTGPIEDVDELTPDTGDDGFTADGSAGDTTVIENPCQVDDDCLALTPSLCHHWACGGELGCVEVADSGNSCDDDNPCTENDFCDQGDCAPGVAVICTDLSPECWSATGTVCIEGFGCPGSAQLESSPCNDGVGPAGGTCVDGWVAPADACDGAGHCLDTSETIPQGLHPLAGEWHAVLSTAPNGGSQETLRADLTLGATGGLSFGNVVTTDPAWAESLTDRNADGGTYCAGLAGDITLTSGSRSYFAAADPTRSVMILAGSSDATLGVALRSTGDASDVSGNYHMVTTAHYGVNAAALMTWQGVVQLEGGCISGPGSLTTTPGLNPDLVYAADNQSSCLVRDGNDWRLQLTVHGENAAIVTTFTWYGAIGSNGDTLLFTRDDGGLHYGTILLVRDRDMASRESMAGNWTFVSQRGGIRDASSTTSVTRFEVGLLVLGEALGALNGVIYGSPPNPAIQGGWWITGDGGSYSQRAAFGDDLVHHSGFVAPSGDFLFAWVVAPPDGDPSQPRVLSVTPLEGSLLVAVRATPFN